MDCAISQVNKICISTSKLGFSSSSSSSFPIVPIVVSLPVQKNYEMKKRAIKCGAKESSCAADNKTWIDKEVDELKKKKGGNIEEVMECLEREALIMEGREAIDYNRRALIFDKSATVFQALKQQTTS